MTRLLVLDACAVVAMILEEPGADWVRSKILAHRGFVHMHAINVFEVACRLMRGGFSGQDAWESAELRGVILSDDCGPSELAFQAAEIKAKTKNLSLGDCFALALAESLNAEFITSDGGFRDCDTTAAITFFR